MKKEVYDSKPTGINNPRGCGDLLYVDISVYFSCTSLPKTTNECKHVASATNNRTLNLKEMFSYTVISVTGEEKTTTFKVPTNFLKTSSG